MESTDTPAERLNAVAGHLNAQHAQLVDVAIDLAADRNLWAGPGICRLDQYLAWRVGLSPSRARQIVAIAERADELPVSTEAFRRGLLSVDQMAAIAARAPWWTDAQISDLGARMTVTQLRRTLSTYPFPHIPPPGDEPADAVDPTGDGAADIGVETDHATSTDATTPAAGSGETDSASTGSCCADVEPRDRWLAYFDDNGRYHLSIETDHATGKIVDNALTEARDRLFHDGQPDVTWTDSLREIANRSLDAIDEPGRRDRYRLHYHLDIHGAAVDAAGARIPDSLRRYLTCDGSWTPIFTDGGRPVSVGRTQRIVPERTRRIVILRDHGCRVPGCTTTRFVEIHHIVHWDDHGPSDTWNLVCLCPHHHRLHHRGRLGITGNADEPDGLTFTNHAGNPIAQSGARPEPPGAPPPPIASYRHPVGERLDGRWLYFNPPPEHRKVVTPTSPTADHAGRRTPLA